MPSNLQPISQKQSKIVISELQNVFWTSIKGGKLENESITYSDGQEGLEKTYAGIAKIEPITLTKPYDPVNDAAIQAFIKKQKAQAKPFNVVVTPINADVAGGNYPNGKPQTYNNCTFISYTPPQFDRNGNGLAMVEMTLAVNSLPTY